MDMDGWMDTQMGKDKKHGIKDCIFLEDLEPHIIPAPTLKASVFFTPKKFAIPATSF
jgi:hypothetical protein